MKKFKPILAFKRVDGDSTTMGKLIGWKTKSEVYHVEIILEDKWVSAYAGRGVYVKDLNPLNDEWEYIHLPEIEMTDHQYKLFMIWLNQQHGKGYDYTGIILAQLFPFSMHRRNKWFCSEIVTKILQLLYVAGVMGLAPYKMSPGDLYRIFKGSRNEC